MPISRSIIYHDKASNSLWNRQRPATLPMGTTGRTVENGRSTRIRLALGQRSSLPNPGAGSVRIELRGMDHALRAQPAHQPGEGGRAGELQWVPQSVPHRENGRDSRSRDQGTLRSWDWRGMVRVGAQESRLRIQADAGTPARTRRIVPDHQEHA